MKKISSLIFIFLMINMVNASVYIGKVSTPNTLVDPTPILTRGNMHHVFSYIVSGVSTNVVIRPEYSPDYNNITSTGNWYYMDDTKTDTTITLDGNYTKYKTSFPTQYIRFNFVSKSPQASTPNITIYYDGLTGVSK